MKYSNFTSKDILNRCIFLSNTGNTKCCLFSQLLKFNSISFFLHLHITNQQIHIVSNLKANKFVTNTSTFIFCNQTEINALLHCLKSQQMYICAISNCDKCPFVPFQKAANYIWALPTFHFFFFFDISDDISQCNKCTFALFLK